MGIFDFILKPIQSILGEVLGFLTGTDFDQEDQSAGVLVNKQSNIDPIPVIYGRRKVGGTRVFISTGGNKNEYLYMAIALSEGQIDAVEEIYINDELWLKDGSVVSGNKFVNLITHGIALGGDDQAYIQMLSEADATWGTNHRLRGIAYVALRFKYDQDVFSGIPDVKCVVRGKKVYDPRTSTTAWSNNPALCLRDYLTNSRYGKGLSTSLIDDDSFIAAANFLDTAETKHTESVTADGSYAIGTTSLDLAGAFTWIQRGDYLQFAGDSTLYELADSQYGAGTVTLANGLTTAVSNGTTVTFKQKIYECNAVIDTGKQLFDNVKTMLQGMRGLMPFSNGVYSLIIDKDETSSFNLTPDNITSEINVQTQGKSKKYNKVTVKFTNPDANWQADSVTYEIDSSTVSTEDNGEELAKSVTMNTITNKYSAKDIAKIICLASRKNELSCKVRATSEALAVAVADIVTLEHPSFGWIDDGVTDARKKFRVIAMQLLDDGEVDLTLQEYDNSIYPWVAEGEIDSGVDTNLPDPFDVTAPTGLNVTAGTELLDDGTVNVFIDISFTGAVDSFLDYYEITVINQTANPDVIVHYEELDYDLDITSLRVNGLAANITYLVSLRAVSSIGAKSATVSDTVSTSPDTTAPTLPSDFNATGELKHNKLTWTNPSEADFSAAIVYRSDALSGTYLAIASVSGGRGEKAVFLDQPLPDDELKYYKLSVVDFSGNQSALSVAQSATTESAPAIVYTPREVHGYVYYQTASATQPSTPSATDYDFQAGADDDPFADPLGGGSTLTSGWSINPPEQDGSDGTYWASRFLVVESTYDGNQSITFSTPFESFVFDGLVTFTNLNNELSDISNQSNITRIDGGYIQTGIIDLGNESGMAVRQGKTSYASTATGFWLGNDSNTPKFNIGTSAKFLRFDGSTLETKEIIIKDSSGNVVFDADEIDGTYIQSATIETLKLEDEAVIVPRENSNGPTSVTFGTTPVSVVGASVSVSNVGQNTRLVIFGAINLQGGTGTGTCNVAIYTGTGTLHRSYGFNYQTNSITVPVFGSYTIPDNTSNHTPTIRISKASGTVTNATIFGEIIVMAAKR